jgi:hypothetical protein
VTDKPSEQGGELLRLSRLALCLCEKVASNLTPSTNYDVPVIPWPYYCGSLHDATDGRWRIAWAPDRVCLCRHCLGARWSNADL